MHNDPTTKCTAVTHPGGLENTFQTHNLYYHEKVHVNTTIYRFPFLVYHCDLEMYLSFFLVAGSKFWNLDPASLPAGLSAHHHLLRQHIVNASSRDNLKNTGQLIAALCPTSVSFFLSFCCSLPHPPLSHTYPCTYVPTAYISAGHDGDAFIPTVSTNIFDWAVPAQFSVLLMQVQAASYPAGTATNPTRTVQGMTLWSDNPRCWFKLGQLEQP